MERKLRFRKMHQHQARMCKIKLMFRQAFGLDVVAAYFQVRAGQCVQEVRINVSGHHTTAIAYTIAKPGRDRTATSSYIQASPSLVDAQVFQVTDSLRIV
jgi:hypothetical protein